MGSLFVDHQIYSLVSLRRRCTPLEDQLIDIHRCPADDSHRRAL